MLEFQQVRSALALAREASANIWAEFIGDMPFHIAEVIKDGVIGGVAARLARDIRSRAATLLEEAARRDEWYRDLPGGSPEARRASQEALEKFLQADRLTLDAESLTRRVGARLPLVGAGISAVAVGVDIHQGKPPAKAVFAEGSGIVGSIGGGMALGAAGGSIAGPPGALVGGVIGGVAGDVGNAASSAWNAVF